MDSSSGAIGLTALLIWGFCGYKAWQLRQRPRGDPGRATLQALVAILAQLAGTFTLTPDAVARLVDSWLHLPGLARFVGNVFSIGTCLALIAFLLFVHRPLREARAALRRHAWVAGGAVVGVTILFAVDHPVPHGPYHFAGVYNYLFLSYITYALVAMVAMAWRYGRISEAPMMRLGLWIVAMSCSLGLVFEVIEIVYLLDQDFDLGVPGSPALAVPVYTVAAVLFVVGLSLPSWGPRLGVEDVWWHAERRVVSRRLRPLWRLISDACPGIVLDRTLLAASPHGQRLIAERLPVEIQDGWLVLRHCLTPDDVERITRLAARHGADAAEVAAAQISVAVHRKATGFQPSSDARPPVLYLGPGDAETLVTEVRFMARVAAQMRSRFVVATLRAIPTPDAASPA